MKQIDMFSFLDEINRPAPYFKKGDVIYKLYLDIVIKGIVEDTYVCGRGNGYTIKEDGRAYNCFWDKDINVTVFSDFVEAQQEANNRSVKYKVIRSGDMKILKERSFVQVVKGSRNFLSATVKLLNGNMVYFQDTCTYPFLEIFKTEGEAEKAFNKIYNKFCKNLSDYMYFETSIHLNTKDMYEALNGNWSTWVYVDHNRPVIINETLSCTA